MNLEIPDNRCDISDKNVVLKSHIIAVYGIYMKVKNMGICRKTGTVEEIQ